MMKVAVLGACVAFAAGNAVVLTNDNFDEHVFNSGKNSLVKFYAPWCGHCKSMAPDYAKLGADYEGSKSVLIGDVDATIESDLGSKYGVSGYPTLKYFTAGNTEPQDFSGGRTYDAMKAWVEENLAVKCDAANGEGCTEKENAFIAKWTGKGADAIAKELARLSGMKASSMKSELRQWWSARSAILAQLKEA